jgi:chromosome segregation ATPase
MLGALLALGALLGLAPVRAQAPVSPSGGAADATRTLGTGAGSGPLLTREELRSCLTQEEALRRRLGDAEVQRKALASEKDTIGADREALSSERAQVEAIKKSIEELGERFKAYSARVESWNARAKSFSDNPPRDSASAERQRDALNQEREQLERERAALEADRARHANQGEQAVQAFNAKAIALDARVEEWNARNAKWTESAGLIDGDRQSWVKACSNRRYREADEVAIRRGQ